MTIRSPGHRRARDPRRHRRAENRRRGVRAWLVAGGTVGLLGVCLAGYVTWQLFGTNVVAHHRAQRILEQTETAWEEGRPQDAPAAAVLRIPRFGENWVVPIVEGTDDDALGRGVGWDPETARPGRVGNMVIAGHRITHGQPFHDFPALQAGDLVQVDVPAPGLASGVRTYTYRLRTAGDQTRVDESEEWPLWPVPSPTAEGRAPTGAVITLITCAEVFHTNSRAVVIGDLIDR